MISNPPHSIFTVWSVLNVKPLAIDTVAVAASPPSVSCVTAAPLESVSVSSHSSALVVRLSLAFAPGPIPFTARTSKVYCVPGSSPVTSMPLSFWPPGALSAMSIQVVVEGTELPAA